MPTSSQGPDGSNVVQLRQPPDPTFLAMAAAMMHEEGRLFEAPDYDYEGAKAAGVKPDERGHMPDTYKLPNHITFSEESKYNDGGAGRWEKEGDKWSFTPGPTNLKHHSMDELREYFRKREPNSILREPK